MALAQLGVNSWAYFVAGATLLGIGVKLVVNRNDECYYIETHRVFSQGDLRKALEQAKAMGLEVIPEWECPPEMLSHGRVRIYLAEAVVLPALV